MFERIYNVLTRAESFTTGADRCRTAATGAARG
jgi:hypothetical protein